jgi:hypothetical protein
MASGEASEDVRNLKRRPAPYPVDKIVGTRLALSMVGSFRFAQYHGVPNIDLSLLIANEILVGPTRYNVGVLRQQITQSFIHGT